ncbi:MAG: hypothetical protein ACRC35_03645, partial [Angustibacter sp.]
MNDTLPDDPGADHSALLSDVLAAVADVLDRRPAPPKDRPHRSWCVPSQHTEGRCVSAALDVSPQLSC